MLPPPEVKVSSVDAIARDWVTELEGREARRIGGTVREARTVVARRLGVPVGSLENIRRLRTKGVRAWLLQRIGAAVMAEMQAEVRRLEHALHITLQSGADPRSSALRAAEAALAEARTQLNSFADPSASGRRGLAGG